MVDRVETEDSPLEDPLIIISLPWEQAISPLSLLLHSLKKDYRIGALNALLTKLRQQGM